MPITPRATRLLRASTLRGFREALVSLAFDGPVHAVRDRVVVVPTRAAGAYLVRAAEQRLLDRRGAMLLPDVITPRDLVRHLATRVPLTSPVLGDAEREVLLGVACRNAAESGAVPPFRLRPGLISEMLVFYDRLRRHQKDVDTFERLALGRLEPGAEHDRGAERLVRQTRFLVAAFREFERRSSAVGDDEHTLRQRLLDEAAGRPFRHAIVAVGDAAFDRHGLHAADWDLLSRVPGLEHLDVVVTDATLAGAPHEEMHRLLPDIEEVRWQDAEPADPWLIVDTAGKPVHAVRDREEEVALFARWVKGDARAGKDPDTMALVVEQPLPYVYVAREVLRSGGIPVQMFDALPLAAEPWAAAFDLVCAAVSADFARQPAIALLRSAQLRFEIVGSHLQRTALPAGSVAALDRALAEAGYLGEADALERLISGWGTEGSQRSSIAAARSAGDVLLAIARELAPLRSPIPAADQLTVLIDFLDRHENVLSPDHPAHDRLLRSRGALFGTLRRLRDAYRRFDAEPVAFDDLAAIVRRWIDSQTFSPRTGDAGVHVVDAESARFADFDMVLLAGLVEAEWPERPRRNIFYPPEVLRDLGWPGESVRRDAARARFADLLRLPASRVAVSTFSLEADAPVSPSSLLDEIDRAGLATVDPPPPLQIFEDEALAGSRMHTEGLDAGAREWAEFRHTWCDRTGPRHHGITDPHPAQTWSLSALERYQNCPFRFFASNVLGLEEEPEDESALSPRARGRFLHEVFQRFFEAWDARGGPLTPECLDEARELCEEVSAPLLARLTPSDAVLERRRLFGSAISIGAVDLVIGLEASRSTDVKERWLEHRFEGAFALGAPEGPKVSLRGVADRVDLLPGRRLRVIDYKSGRAPDPKRALQASVYALCVQEQLEQRDQARWTIDEAAYVAFSGRRATVQTVGGHDAAESLAAARSRVMDVVDGIHGGVFPPRPHDPLLCGVCAFASVCRQDSIDEA